MNNKLIVQGKEIHIAKINDDDFISLTSIVNALDSGETVIGNWMSNKNTVEFLGLWESIHNNNFNLMGFHEVKNEAGLNRVTMSPKKWHEKTNAVGIVSKSGRYGGGTYAHKEIAMEFCSWLSPTFKLYLFQEFDRLKSIESSQQNMEWDVKRILSKANYHLHTAAVKECIIPLNHNIKEGIVYASEADVINYAMFGCSAKQWRDANPQLAAQGLNIRDMASINQLMVLSNMEQNNAIFIRNGIADKQARYDELKKLAQYQLNQFNKIYPEKAHRKAIEGNYATKAANNIAASNSTPKNVAPLKQTQEIINPELSDFNKKLTQAPNFNPKEKKKKDKASDELF